jgi:hypothetical protein
MFSLKNRDRRLTRPHEQQRPAEKLEVDNTANSRESVRIRDFRIGKTRCCIVGQRFVCGFLRIVEDSCGLSRNDAESGGSSGGGSGSAWLNLRADPNVEV